MYDIDKQLLDETIYQEQFFKATNHADSFANFLEVLRRWTGLISFEYQTYHDMRQYIQEYIATALKDTVEDNCIRNLSIKNIVNFVTYHCAVLKDDLFIGSASIILVNSFNRDKANSLVLHNGNQVFKYDIKGISPSSVSKDNPIKPLALSFTIYDENGLKIDDAVVEKNYEIKWKLPKENTLLKMKETSDIEEGGYLIYSDLYLPFEIASLYNHNKNNNEIQLEIIRDDLSLQATTNFSFLKEGSLDTNGSEFFCRIVPNTTEILQQYPMLTIFPDGTYQINYEIEGVSPHQWFKVQFWKLDKMLWEKVSGDNITWSILTNRYGNFTESSDIQVNSKTGDFSLTNLQEPAHPANIIKVTVVHEDKQYFATLPLAISRQLNNRYRISLDKESGFHNVVYASDGTKPQYNTSIPFKFQVQKRIDDLWVDISNSTNIDYNFEIKGNVFKQYIYDEQLVYLINNKEQFLTNNQQQFLIHPNVVVESDVLWENIYLLENKELDEDDIPPLKNEKYFLVKDNYNGQCVNAGFKVFIKNMTGQTLAQLHVPIHFLLDKEGHAALGDWDGNSIQINDTTGGAVLTPQAGAGNIDSESGNFTGVFLGSATNSQNKMQTGLLGYHNGEQSIFLDAETGKAEFGTSSKIIIDPTNGTAQIYSGNYQEKDSDNNITGAGMLIDLAEPAIKFGTKSFMLDAEGRITASDGKIAGWHIDEHAFYSGNAESPVRLSATDFSAKIGEQYREDWRFTIGNRFGITSQGEMYSNSEVWKPGEAAPQSAQTSGSFSGYFNIKLADIEKAQIGSKMMIDQGAIYVPKIYEDKSYYTTFNSMGNNEVAFAAAAVSDDVTGVPGYHLPANGTPVRIFHNGLAEFKNIDIQGGTINLHVAKQDKNNNVPRSKQGITVKVDANTEYSFEEYINNKVSGAMPESEVLDKLNLYSQNGNNQPTHIYSALPLYADGFFIKERQIIAEEWIDVPVSIMDKIQALEDRIAELERLNQDQE